MDKVKEYVRWDKVTKQGNAKKGITAGALHVTIRECPKEHPQAMCTDNAQAIADKGMAVVGKMYGNREIMAMDFFTKPEEVNSEGRVWSVIRGKWKDKALYLAFQLPTGAKGTKGTAEVFDIDALL